ncbi:MAG TPA: retropepsin-like domain-containing protein [Candidatus Paenibacillus intestinavium]|nr:retropepsin-like domain-containing protein [Candidatus Paenibacillus intestinavium]
MQIEYRDGLLFTSIEINYLGRTKTIDNIVIDTGASHTLLSQDVVDDLGIKVSAEDEIVTSYGITLQFFVIRRSLELHLTQYSRNCYALVT